MKNVCIVSVLMPAYNAEKTIAEAIESILSQTFQSFELIIADDCSTDATRDIIRSYERKDPRIKAIYNKMNLYIAGNRNILLKYAKGKYIAWQDADDISLPKRLEHQVAFLDTHAEVGIVGGYLQFFNEKGNTSLRKYATNDEDLRKNIFKFSPVAQPGAMIRKKCLDEMGEYDLRFPPAEDLDMSFRIGTKYKFANLPEVVIKYRENYSSATFKRLRKIERSTLEIRNNYKSHPMYAMSVIDKIYNVLQFLSLYIVPSKMKIALFNRIRNKK